jgi:hypothetical protein
MLRVGGFGYDDRAIYRMAWTFEGLNGRVEGTSYLSSGYIATVVIEMWCYHVQLLHVPTNLQCYKFHSTSCDQCMPRESNIQHLRISSLSRP